MSLSFSLSLSNNSFDDEENPYFTSGARFFVFAPYSNPGPFTCLTQTEIDRQKMSCIEWRRGGGRVGTDPLGCYSTYD